MLQLYSTESRIPGCKAIQYSSFPRIMHLNSAHRVLRYLYNTSSLGVYFESISNPQLWTVTQTLSGAVTCQTNAWLAAMSLRLVVLQLITGKQSSGLLPYQLLMLNTLQLHLQHAKSCASV